MPTHGGARRQDGKLLQLVEGGAHTSKMMLSLALSDALSEMTVASSQYKSSRLRGKRDLAELASAYRLYREAEKKRSLDEESMAEKLSKAPKTATAASSSSPAAPQHSSPSQVGSRWAHPRTWARLRV